MERNFTNENFERFLRQNADGLRMHPSDKVWGSIARRLNRRRRRFGLLLACSLMVAGGLGYYLVGPSVTGHHHPASTVKTNALSVGLSQISQPLGPSTGMLAFHQPTPHGSSDKIAVRQGKRQTVPMSPANISVAADEGTAKSDGPNEFMPTIVDSYLEGDNRPATALSTALLHTAADPLTIESVVNTFHPRTSKFGMQIYFAPTFSYRKLHDNNINNIVIHKPDFGFEIGLSGKYPIASNLKVVGGIQFNVNRYGIKTFNSSPQYATIRLNNGLDSLSAATNYNNFGGYRSNWLENFFFQISAPVGLELKMKGNNRTQFGIAATLQPTYILGDRAYLISSDYKNYAEVPRLIRRWNMNTSLETFVAYSTGHLKWQVGPQVRYQMYSTYDRKYPVKENLFDFGLKIGIGLNNQ